MTDQHIGKMANMKAKWPTWRQNDRLTWRQNDRDEGKMTGMKAEWQPTCQSVCLWRHFRQFCLHRQTDKHGDNFDFIGNFAFISRQTDWQQMPKCKIDDENAFMSIILPSCQSFCLYVSHFGFMMAVGLSFCRSVSLSVCRSVVSRRSALHWRHFHHTRHRRLRLKAKSYSNNKEIQ